MATRFVVKPHTLRLGSEIVEVWVNDRFMATISDHNDLGVRVISKHLDIASMSLVDDERASMVIMPFKETPN